jgi:hypothetical protein
VNAIAETPGPVVVTPTVRIPAGCAGVLPAQAAEQRRSAIHFAGRLSEPLTQFATV